MIRRALFLLLFFIPLSVPLSTLADPQAPAANNPELTAADQLYDAGKFAEAAGKYQAILKSDSKLAAAQAGLIRCWLKQDKIDEAFAAATADVAAQPNSAPLLAAMGDVQFRLAEMPQAEGSFLKALAVDPKNVHAHLGLATLYRCYSLYRQAYNQLQAAHQIAPNDPEVQRRWLGQLTRKERIAALEAYLAAPHPDDAEDTAHLRHYLDFLRATVDKPVHACKLVNRVETTESKLESMYRDPKHVVGFGLVVKINDRKQRLLLDTGASGIMIGRKAAEKAGLTRISDISYRGIGDKGPQSGYVAVADQIKIGELEFRDCVVHVSDRVSVTDEDGLIGSDVFSSYLIDLDLSNQKLMLSPLPKRPDETAAPSSLQTQGEGQTATDNKEEGSDETQAPVPDKPAPADKAAEPDKPALPDKTAPSAAKPTPRLPQDRYVAPEMAQWTKVFRFGHSLLIPTSVDHSPSMLFLIDTGAQFNALSQRAAKQVTKTSADPYSRVQGLSGEVDKVYRAENANIVFGHMAQKNQSVLTWDLSSLARAIGTEVSGIIGFPTLHLLQVKIDYRDGLVDFAYDAKRWGTGTKF